MAIIIGHANFENTAQYYERVYQTMREFKGFKEERNPRTGVAVSTDAPDQTIVRLHPADGHVTKAKAFLAAELIVKGEYRLATDDEIVAYEKQIHDAWKMEEAKRSAAAVKLTVVPYSPGMPEQAPVSVAAQPTSRR